MCAAGCAVAAADDGVVSQSSSLDERSTGASSQAAGASSAQLHYEISQTLWGCYAVGADLVGVGDVARAKETLRKCFAPDMEFKGVMPPAYAALGFTSTNGADGFVDFANQFYRSFGFTRTQHSITNLVVQKTGPDTATARSSGFAAHVYADEHVLNATVRFEDELQRSHGVWKFVRKTMTVTSLTQMQAWNPQP
jgi:hypothetical protein